MPKWTLTKKFRFEAAHMLPHHDGKCARLHGHSFEGWVTLEGDALVEEGPKQGMLVDFHDVNAALKPLLENQLDHYYLNDSLGMLNPTSEVLARWLFQQLFPCFGSLLIEVGIDETCTSACTYRPR